MSSSRRGPASPSRTGDPAAPSRAVAELGPPPSTGEALDRLIAEGRVTRPTRRGLPEPLQLAGDPHALSRALDEIRGDR